MSDIQERLLAAFQVEHREHLETVRAMLDELAQNRFDIASFEFEEAHRRVHSLKGAARVVGLQAVETLAHRLETLISRCQSGGLALNQEAVAVAHRALDGIEDYVAAPGQDRDGSDLEAARLAVERLLEGVAAPSPAAPREPPPAPARPAPAGAEQAPPSRAGTAAATVTTRVNVDSLDLVLRHSREILTESLHHRQITLSLRELRRELQSLQRDLAREHDAPVSGADDRPGSRPGPSLARPASAALDPLLDRVKSMSRLQGDAAWRLERQSQQLHRALRGMRIVPAESVFGGVRRVVHDLATAEGKEAEVVVRGLAVQADRQVLQALRDPVMHLLRNAVGHGIEPAEVRAERGKPSAGRISFNVSAQRNRLLLRIEDDGSGLDAEHIVASAVSRGLLPEDAPAIADFGVLTRLLVQPGFTTARSVTELSGRGFGLSVVDKAVGQLQGTFDLAPSPSGGTLATISVPLALSGSQVLLVRCRQQTYAIPLHWIQRLWRLKPTDIVTVKGEPTFAPDRPDEPVPLASLAQLLGLEDAGVEGDDEHLLVVLLKSGNLRLGVAVDQIVEVHDAVLHDLDAAAPGLSLASGALMLADGTLCVVVNPVELLRAAREAKPSWSLDKGGRKGRSEPPLIGVVDDSITTRTLEKSILEAKGYRVRLCVDGVDALERFREETPELVIADIEMPRMDGFELLNAMRDEQSLAGIPVILVTSRNNDRDRRKGLSLGAAAYIVKQRFDQGELLQVIEQIL